MLRLRDVLPAELVVHLAWNTLGRAFDLGIDFSWSSAVIWWREVIVAVPRLISGQRFLSIGSWYLWCTGHSTKLDLGVLLNILAA